MLTFNDLKPIFLSIAILIGWIAHCDRAHAAEPQVLTVAGGCFWCVEADFESVKGVQNAVSGYTGGSVENPSYKQVSHGGTGHYEAVQIRFNPDMVSRETLLDLFFRSVDPTDAGGQFCDRGDSYRTAIFVSDPAAKAQAEAAKSRAEAVLGRKIVTSILPETQFYPAEGYHQDYYKGKKTVLTRFGPIKQWKAYKRYRESCGRDRRVRELWGDAAAFAGN